jgi:hypothetical protein
MSIWEANCYSKFNLLIKKEKLDGDLRHIGIKWSNWNVEELTKEVALSTGTGPQNHQKGDEARIKPGRSGIKYTSAWK